MCGKLCGRFLIIYGALALASVLFMDTGRDEPLASAPYWKYKDGPLRIGLATKVCEMLGAISDIFNVMKLRDANTCQAIPGASCQALSSNIELVLVDIGLSLSSQPGLWTPCPRSVPSREYVSCPRDHLVNKNAHFRFRAQTGSDLRVHIFDFEETARYRHVS